MMSQDCIAHPSLEQRFLSQHHFALIGFSTTGRKFGNYIYRKLSAKGLRILPVNPAGTVVDGAGGLRITGAGAEPPRGALAPSHPLARVCPGVVAKPEPATTTRRR